MQPLAQPRYPHPWFGWIVSTSLALYVLFAAHSVIAVQTTSIVCALTWATAVVSARGRMVVSWPLAVPFAAFLVLSLLSAAFAADPLLAFSELRSAWVPILFIPACATHLATAPRATLAVRGLIAGGCVWAVVGLSQAATHGSGFRITGTLGHYMTFAGVLMLTLTLALAQLLFNRRSRRDLWLVPAALLLFAALMMTHTRSAWLGLGAGLLLLLWLYRRWLLLLLPVLWVVTLLVAPQAIRTRMVSMLDLRDVTAVERVYMWGAGWRMFLDHPLVGVGPCNARRLYPKYQHADDPWIEGRRFTHLHNNAVQILAERGLPATVAWIVIWVVFFVRTARRWQATNRSDPAARALVAGALAGVVAFLVAGMFEYNYGDAEVVTLAFFAMALPLPDAYGSGSAAGRSACSRAASR